MGASTTLGPSTLRKTSVVVAEFTVPPTHYNQSMETFPVDQVLFFIHDRVDRAAALQREGLHAEADILIEDAQEMAELMDTNPQLLFA